MKKEFNLKEMKEYKGINPKPSNFDSFWTKQIKSLKKFSSKIQISPILELKNKNIGCYDLYFTSFDGAKIYAKYLRPQSSKDVPCVLQFHGYPGSSRSFFELSSFVDAGFAVLAMDCRGQGGKSEDLGGVLGTTVSGHVIVGIDDDVEKMLFCKTYKDTVCLVKIAESLEGIDKKNLFVNGASQGGGLATVCAALNPSIKKAEILYPFLSDFKRVYDLDYDQVAYEGLRYYSRWFDPLGINIKSTFTKLGYIDVSNFAPRIKAEDLFGISLADTICPPSTQFAVYNNIASKKNLNLYRGKGHETIHDFDDKIIPFLLGDNCGK